MHNYGILDTKAPAWGVDTWFNLPDGQQTIDRQDFEGKVVYLYCFQSWCPGCHSHGFPTLQLVKEQIGNDSDVTFVAIQTVFEGFGTNTAESALQVAQQYSFDIPFGHDPGPDGHRSTIMQRYRTGGTPWTIIIDKSGLVRFNDFHATSPQMINLIEQLKSKR